ncbi:transglutaminase family protein [Sulfobacillus thermosulfidooxidans]|uniref:transglutaminase family protein n=1 Tax=Sulfobacillus thermosulfidooxidans TaxID=28034 RepID=UPI0006B4D79A|nr:transglutaminase family protein [Sulfobacillus thermosulfidooxidans]
MNIVLRHDTIYRYKEPIFSLASELHLRPLNNARQIVESFQIMTSPSTHLYDYIDRFGNTVHHFTIPRHLQTVEISAVSRVITMDQPFVYRMPTGFLGYESLTPTMRTMIDEETKSWIYEIDHPELPVLERVHQLTQATHQYFTYEAGVTTVLDTAKDFMRLKRGVCQDFAHFLISVCRYLQIPTLYVSGYLIPENEAPTASHAWVAVYTGEFRSKQWTGFDPVSGTFTNDRYIWLALGRDYGDVTPVRGVYWGTRDEDLQVSIQIEE